MKVELVSNWTQFWRMYSIWFFALVAVLPDAFNLAVAYGLLETENAPESLSYTIKVICFLGALARLVKQQALVIEAEQNQTP